MEREHTLFTDWLAELGVPYTQAYSVGRFESMPFRSWFGLAKLMEEYGVGCEGYRLDPSRGLEGLQVPFVAQTSGGYVIVKRVDRGVVTYLTQGVEEQMAADDFVAAWCGRVLLAFPSADACEPDYRRHRRLELMERGKVWVWRVLVVALGVYLFATGGLWRFPSAWFVAALDLLGLWLTWMLVRKSLNRSSASADRVCGVLQAGGCDTVLGLGASKFFGLFGWAEVGLSYFSVSLLALLMFPQWLGCVALCNLCCLPFTVWSIWYQKCRAGVWCTLCVCVQCTLWLLFFAYLWGGWYHGVWPPAVQFWVLGVTYVVVMLGINRLMPFFDRKEKAE